MNMANAPTIEAGTSGLVKIENPTSEKISFFVPKSNKQATIHIILEVSDNGEPALVSYRRISITVTP